MPRSKVPGAFADPKSRKLVGAWISSELKEAEGKPISGNPIVRLINRDKQGILYVANLHQQPAETNGSKERNQ